MYSHGGFLMPAIERERKQFPALKEYFRKLPDSDKNIAKNVRYKQIMTLLTSPETMVQLCFLESVKPIFDKFLESFQVEGPFNTQSLPMHGSPSEANDVLVSEAKGTTEENCSRTVEIGYEAFRFSVEGQ